MNDKYAKEIAKELKLIRRELERINKPAVIKVDDSDKQRLEDALKGNHVTLQVD